METLNLDLLQDKLFEYIPNPEASARFFEIDLQNIDIKALNAKCIEMTNLVNNCSDLQPQVKDKFLNQIKVAYTLVLSFHCSKLENLYTDNLDVYLASPGIFVDLLRRNIKGEDLYVVLEPFPKLIEIYLERVYSDAYKVQVPNNAFYEKYIEHDRAKYNNMIIDTLRMFNEKTEQINLISQENIPVFIRIADNPSITSEAFETIMAIYRVFSLKLEAWNLFYDKYISVYLAETKEIPVVEAEDKTPISRPTEPIVVKTEKQTEEQTPVIEAQPAKYLPESEISVTEKIASKLEKERTPDDIAFELQKAIRIMNRTFVPFEESLAA